MSFNGSINKVSGFASNAANSINDYTKQAQEASSGQGGGLDSVNQAADWIKNAADSAMALIDKARLPLQKVPPLLLLCRLKYLPGLSATALTATIIQSLANQGFVTELNVDGTPNDIVKFVQCIVGPFIQHIKDCASVQGMVETQAGIYPVDGKVD